MFLTGPAGSGKTYAAILAACAHMSGAQPTRADYWDSDRRIILRPHEIAEGMKLESVPELLSKIRATFRADGGPRESDIVDNLSRKLLLIVDDLGAEKQSDWSMGVLYLILNRRIDNLRPTIVTSNLTLREIDAIDPRLASRIGSMRCVEMKGRDRRLAK